MEEEEDEQWINGVLGTIPHRPTFNVNPHRNVHQLLQYGPVLNSTGQSSSQIPTPQTQLASTTEIGIKKEIGIGTPKSQPSQLAQQAELQHAVTQAAAIATSLSHTHDPRFGSSFDPDRNFFKHHCSPKSMLTQMNDLKTLRQEEEAEIRQTRSQTDSKLLDTNNKTHTDLAFSSSSISLPLSLASSAYLEPSLASSIDTGIYSKRTQSNSKGTKRRKKACRLCYLTKKKCSGHYPCTRCKAYGLVCEERRQSDTRPSKKIMKMSKKIPWEELRPDVTSLLDRMLQLRINTKMKPNDMASLSRQVNQAQEQRRIPTNPTVCFLDCDHELKDSELATMVKEWRSCPPSCSSTACGPKVIKYYWNPALQTLLGHSMEEVLVGYQSDGDASIAMARYVTPESVFKLMGLISLGHGSTFITAIHRSGREFQAALQWSNKPATQSPHLTRQYIYVIPIATDTVTQDS